MVASIPPPVKYFAPGLLIRVRTLEVLYFGIPPLVSKVLGDQSAMTMMRGWLAAKYARAIKEPLFDLAFDMPRSDKPIELLLVRTPVSAGFFVGIKDVFCWSKKRYVDVLYAENFPQEVAEIVLLCEAG